MSELVIQARGLCRTYRIGAVETPALREVDLDVPEGAFAVVTGPSGCGKSTLLNLLGAIDTVDRGSLQVGGVRLDGASKTTRRRFRRDLVGFVFQGFNLLPTLSALENVQAGLEPLRLGQSETRERATASLVDVGLGDKGARFPDQLSVGEQQRVAVARALARRPVLVLADEPTGSLDRASSDEVVGLLQDLRAQRGITCVVVTHDPVVAEAATHAYHLLDGRIVDP